MPGLFGVIARSATVAPPELRLLAAEMAKRLSLRPGYVVNQRSYDGAVIGRYGAPFHHSMAWPGDGDAPIVAGRFGGEPGWAGHVLSGQIDALRAPFAVVARQGAQWLIATDRCGSVPIYFAEAGGYLFFASEVRALLVHPALSRAVDQGALAMVLASGQLTGDKTLFRSIRRLRGGQALRVEPGAQIAIETYWTYRPGSRQGELGRRELVRGLGERLIEAMQRQFTKPDETVLLLSGGSGSRALLGAALELFPADRIRAVTYANREAREDADLTCAIALARRTGIRHRVLSASPSGIPQAFPLAHRLSEGHMALDADLFALLAQLAGEGATVLLRGDLACASADPVDSLEGALAELGLRRIDHIPALTALLRPERLMLLRAASHRVLGAILAEAEGLRPSQARDAIGFDHPLQSFLASSAAGADALFAQVMPLRDDAILDLMEFAPDELRTGKVLFGRAMARRFPLLWRMPFARARSMIEDLRPLMTAHTPLRSHILGQLGDRSSAIWDLFDRGEVAALFGALTAEKLERPAATSQSRWRLGPLKEHLPAWAVQPLGGAALPSQREPAVETIVMRLIAIKHWFDCQRYEAPAELERRRALEPELAG